MRKTRKPDKNFATGTMAAKLTKARRENAIRSCFKIAEAKLSNKPDTIFSGINNLPEEN